MFLDPNNCYYKNGVGLLVFWSELGKILFYAEKKGKTLEIGNLTYDESFQSLKFISKVKNLNETTFLKRVSRKVLPRGNETTIFFKSQCTNDFFKNFFIKERYGTDGSLQDIMRAKGQIDYLLVLKQSIKTAHTSEVEPRILRIDWGANEIKYYGDKDYYPNINDHLIPVEYPLEHHYSPQDSGPLLVPPKFPNRDDFVKALEVLHDQLINNGYAHFLVGDKDNFNSLVEYLKKAGFFLNTYTSDDVSNILEILDSSSLKCNWMDTIKNKRFSLEHYGITKSIAQYINDTLCIQAEEVNLNGLVPKLQDETAFQYIFYDMEKFKNNDSYLFKYTINIPFNDDSVPKNIMFNFNKRTLLSQQNNNEKSKYKIKYCGAENCYFPVKDNRDKQYGLRLSAFVFTIDDHGLYNAIIENIINAMIWFYCNMPGLSDKLPEISKVVKFGLIKVMFTSQTNPDTLKEGYIPYTLTEHKPDYIQLKTHQLNLCNKEETLNIESDINPFILKVLEQVYNFFAFVRPYFKFSHNDFKTDNILINPETKKLYIIDFGHAQMTFFNGKRNIYLTSRIDFFNNDAIEYDFYLKNMNDVYSTDHDIATLLYWLMSPYKYDDKVVLQEINEEIKLNPTKANKLIYHKMVKTQLESLSKILFFI